MIGITIGSKNPVKCSAMLRGFESVFPTESFEVNAVEVPSGVFDQPVGDDETRRGALNRVREVMLKHPQSQYWAAIEGGVSDFDGQMTAFAWIVITNGLQTGYSRTATFYLPEKIASLVRSGMELGHADDQVFGRENSKQKNGAVGILTHDAIDREALYTHAVKLALIPFLNPTLYPETPPFKD